MHRLHFPSRYPFCITTGVLLKSRCVLFLSSRTYNKYIHQTLKDIVQESGRILAHAFKLEITEPTFLDLTRYVTERILRAGP